MYFIVDKTTEKVIGKCDAWDMETQRQLERDAKRAGYHIVEREITFSGNMIVWCEF